MQIENSKAIGFTSNINNTDYELQIALPSRYSESKKHYPVVYLLDANNDFPLVTSISRRLYQEDNLDPIIIVGISYKKNAYSIMYQKLMGLYLAALNQIIISL